MQRRIVVTTLSLAAVVTAGVALCGRRAVSTHGVALAAASKGEGLVFRLSEGVEEAASARPAAGGPTEPLTEQETQRVLDRLPAMTPEPDQARDFALREKSLPPPRTGKTVSAPFPPAAQVEGPRTGAAGALEVVRHAPDGDVALAPNLSVTFSQPMVAVTSQEEAAQTVPVRLTPTPPGKWRWVGTKTLLFEPTGRFPMATVYKAEIPAGTKPALGGTLARAFEWRFSTPPPTIVEKYPADRPTPRGPLIFVAFDQKIDDAAVLGTITVTAGTTRATLRLAAPAEIQADAQVRELAARAERGRWLAFLPVEPLPGDSAVRVTVGPRTPSLEGPRETVKKQEWTFRTYGPMRVTSHRCGWEPTCRPSNPWQIEFSNQIDARKFTKEMVRVVPELPGMKVASGGNWLTISGASRGMTSYKVTLAAELPDEFGQTLAAAQTLTFDVDKAQPSLLFPGGSMVVLDPVAPPALSVYSTQQPSLDVKAYAVAPDDWAAFLKFSQHEKDAGPPGRLVFTKKLVPQADVSEQVETSIDLAEALPSKLGQLVVVVDPAIRPKERWRGDSVRVWVQSTRIGLDAFVDSTDLTVWATNLADGKPLADVSLELSPNGGKASSTADGLATLSLSSQPLKVLVARKGQDVAILTDTDYYWSNGWQRGARGDGAIWHVFDDRGLYRPGEEARVKGWVRAAGYGQGGDVAAFSETTRTLTYILKDSRGNEVTKGQAALNAFGGFDLALRLPKTMNLGPAALALDVAAPGCCTHLVHALRVQEFRRPEFEVTAKTNEGPFFIGGHALVTAKAAYYAGGVLASAETTWRVTATAGSFVPPGRDDFIFGHWKPWWEHDGYDAAESQPSTLPGRTGADGQHILRIDFDSARPPQAWSVRAEASIKDVNRQEWTATSTMLVHPASVYVGLRSERLFVQQGQPLQLSVIATDLDGRAAAGRPVTLRAERLDWEQDAGEWKERVVDPQTREVASAERAVRAEFATKEGGTYRVTATVADEQGRINETQIRLWVAGGKQPARRNVEQEKVTLIPDKKEYRAGETAEILVVAPFANSEGLLTLRRSGIVRTERFRMQASSHTLKVKIEEAWTPNVYAQVDLVGAAPRADDQGRVDTKLAPRPAFASGSLDLAVPPYQRTLTLAVTPKDKALEPAGSTEVTVQVRDASGQPLAHAEVALVVADEAVLALAGYELADPLKSIYPHRDPGAQDRHQRTALLLAAPEAVAEPQALGVDKGRLRSLAYIQNNAVAGGAALDMAIPPPAAAPMPRRAMQVVTKSGVMPQQLEDEKAGAGEAQPIALRADFNPLALFVASAVTDAQGRATATVKLPDNVTRYRVMAVATDGAKRFGKGESTITARLPLMVRPSAPRFLNFGDRFELPIVVQNQTDAPIKVDVAARALNAAFLADAAAVAQGSDKTAPSSGRRVTVPANDRVEVRLPATAVRAGTARFQIGAVSGRWSDAADVSLPVWTPATTEAFATYGQIDNEKPIVQPIQAPSAVVREYGGLEVTTSSTALSALTDAVMYLAKYPYGCAEQISSRVLAVAALKDVLAAFQAEGLPARDEMLAAVKRDLDRLKALQNNDGGFAFWRYGDESWPYVSIHAAHAMVRAQEKGFAVDAQALDKAKKYLREIESHIPKWYGDNARRTLIAYALSVRQRLGDRDTARARKLIAEVGVEKLSFEAIGWLLGVLSGDPESQIEVAAIRHFLANRATETASTAHFAVDYGDSAYVLLYSDRRADAIVLDALIGDQPANDLIPKLVEGLLGHRTAGRWLNTQENVFILLALDRYFNTYEKVTPDFVARAWLGDRYAGEHAFRGRTTERSHIEIPMEHLGSAGKTQDLIVAKEGKGRLYYRIGMQYAPASLTLQPADYGFTVERRYEGLDKKDDVRRDAAGVWHVKAGSRVRVTLTMVAPSRRYHVALVDPLPAGLEPLNPELATTGTIPQGPGEDVTLVGGPGLGGPSRPGMWWWWTRTWYEHQNMRDERVEAFTSLLFEGVYRYSYAAQATTPGVFVVPPPKAEEMYHPETFGRGGTDRLVVE
jgi:alpha-2-macroglobulin